MEYDFPLWVRITHAFNFLFLTLLWRSGLEILGSHPKLYWSDDSPPWSPWLRFSRKHMPRDRLWTSEDEITPFPSWLALPGRDNLGLGRHWHFWSLTGWVVTGVVYVVLLFATPQWRRLVPTSWDILPGAVQVFLDYVHLRLPPEGDPFNPLQQLTYFLLIFFLSPLQILTGLLMSPALDGFLPWLPRLVGGRQVARSIHFLGLIAFFIFFLIHITLVILHGFGFEMAKIVLGNGAQPQAPALAIGLSVIAAVILLHTVGTLYSLRRPLRAKKLLQIGISPWRRALFHHWPSRQDFRRISSYARVNGRPPRNAQFEQLAANGFQDYQLVVSGLVAQPLSLSLAELRAMPSMEYGSMHTCIQGWTYFARWKGVPVQAILERCQPLPEARYLLFRTLDEKWENRPGGPSSKKVDHGYAYEVIDLELARRPQTILAYEMNGAQLPLEHGRPLRLRVEGQLGYKMVKWVSEIELIEDFRFVGWGQGGWRDDVLNYDPADAGI